MFAAHVEFMIMDIIETHKDSVVVLISPPELTYQLRAIVREQKANNIIGASVHYDKNGNRYTLPLYPQWIPMF